MIVALGDFAAQTLLETTDPISRLRGRVLDYGGAPLDADVPPGLPAAKPGTQARRLGRPETSEVAAAVNVILAAPASNPRDAGLRARGAGLRAGV